MVSFVYERGWRQNFARSGFPGPDEEVRFYFQQIFSFDPCVVCCWSCDIAYQRSPTWVSEPNGDLCSSKWPKSISSQFKEVSSLTSAVGAACSHAGLHKAGAISLSSVWTFRRTCFVNLTSSSDKMCHFAIRES